jgi:hypothetical protein
MSTASITATVPTVPSLISGPDRLTALLSHQQVDDSAVAHSCIVDIDATVKWDQCNPSQLIRILEGCGQS